MHVGASKQAGDCFFSHISYFLNDVVRELHSHKWLARIMEQLKLRRVGARCQINRSFGILHLEPLRCGSKLFLFRFSGSEFSLIFQLHDRRCLCRSGRVAGRRIEATSFLDVSRHALGANKVQTSSGV